ncbi:MAG: nodulation protein NfeD [Candidatus Eisenbacteria bacterium]|nr:nodulation protein NfeD [Candidatus Eisenbacteria bacterium]
MRRILQRPGAARLRAALQALFLAAVAGIAWVGAQDAPEEAESELRTFAGDIYWIRLQQAIEPVAAEFFKSSLEEAEEEGGAAFVLELDTPGGLDTSMRTMIKSILAARIPVVVYVSPSGSRAASAGVFITLAAHVAAMAPGTNIGAAHPVSVGGGGEMDTVMSEKVTNDAVAYIRSLAQRRDRNVEWAEEAVRKSVSLSAEEALGENVVDLVVPDRAALLDSLHGRVLVTGAGRGRLETEDAGVVELEMGLRERILSIISNPNVAYVLFLLGLMGLFFELSNPGALLPGILGSICIILAFFAFQTLPVSAAGILLILLAVVLFLLEIKVTSYGALTIGGVVSLLLGSLMLFRSPIPALRVSLEVVIPAVALTAAFFIFAIGMGLGAQRKRKVSGREGLVGEIGAARTDVHRQGKVFIHGEIWNAYAGQPVAKDTPVRVVAVNGLRLHVEPCDEEAARRRE